MTEILQTVLFCLIGISTVIMLCNLIITKHRLVQFISVNVITSYAIVFICALVVFENESYVDVALIYALLSFIVSVAVMKYYKQ